jgi:hypothetical protein
MEISDRIKTLRNHYCGGNNLKFAELMGEKPNVTSLWISGKRNIGRSVIDKILDKLPDVSPTWLLTGSGEMLSTSPLKTSSENEKPHRNRQGFCYFSISSIFTSKT